MFDLLLMTELTSTLRSSSTVTLTATQCAVTSAVISTTSSTVTSVTCDLVANGLCKTCQSQQNNTICFGSVKEGEHEYEIYSALEQPFSSTTTLADVLLPGSRVKLPSRLRYGIALTLASSHLQLHSTPWLEQHWTSRDVHLAISVDQSKMRAEPYIVTPIPAAASTTTTTKKDRSFSTLGIVLLELCFNTSLETHELWQNPAYTALKTDPMIRQTVACEWLAEVPEEAGDDYATAVDWTLRQAPVVCRDDKWRAEFAQNVVQPLQRHYDYLNREKSAV